MRELVGEYNENGVVKIPAVFQKQEMDLLRLQAFECYKNKRCAEMQYKNNFPVLMFYPELDYFSKDARFLSVARNFLGNNVHRLNHQVYFRMPGDADEFGWHQDITFRSPKENFAGIESGYIQTAIVIDDMDEDNSPIEFVHGSHLNGDLNLVPRGTENGLRKYEKKFKGIPMTAKSGDVLVWSVMIVHASKPNNSSKHRMYLMNGLADSECIINKNGFDPFLRNGIRA